MRSFARHLAEALNLTLWVAVAGVALRYVAFCYAHPVRAVLLMAFCALAARGLRRIGRSGA